MKSWISASRHAWCSFSVLVVSSTPKRMFSLIVLGIKWVLAQLVRCSSVFADVDLGDVCVVEEDFPFLDRIESFK